jgi:phosphotransferase system  glucose/maltose/N-acetylglucosamine-specific IIC component
MITSFIIYRFYFISTYIYSALPLLHYNCIIIYKTTYYQYDVISFITYIYFFTFTFALLDKQMEKDNDKLIDDLDQALNNFD